MIFFHIFSHVCIFAKVEFFFPFQVVFKKLGQVISYKITNNPLQKDFANKGDAWLLPANVYLLPLVSLLSYIKTSHDGHIVACKVF